MGTRIKIDPPTQLPSSGLSSIQYKQWKLALEIFMHQTAEFREYYPGGLYPTWKASDDDPNLILSLNPADSVPENTTVQEHLAQRRILLKTFLGIIARYSDEGDFDDIIEKSCSLESIYQIHERRYGIQRKGRHLFRLDSIRFDKATMSDYLKFYNNIRSCFKSNMRKAGETYKNKKLTEDEKLTPTTECLLVQLTLERIDARLPAEIDRVFGHRMDNETGLIDLQTEIFSYIPRALAALDKEENMSCNASCLHQQAQQGQPDQHDLNALYSRQQRPAPPRPAPRSAAPRSQPPLRTSQFRRPQKFCKICQALELPQAIVNSHYPSECRKKLMLQELELYENDAQVDEELYQVPAPDPQD